MRCDDTLFCLYCVCVCVSVLSVCVCACVCVCARVGGKRYYLPIYLDERQKREREVDDKRVGNLVVVLILSVCVCI